LNLRFLSGEITSYPFSPVPLSSESQLILPHLLRLAKRGWWPVGSQPAVDGLPSDDDTVGWGPAGGYVFQKPFVEFFASAAIVEKLEKAVAAVNGVVDFLAGNNAVRWGPYLCHIQTSAMITHHFVGRVNSRPAYRTLSGTR